MSAPTVTRAKVTPTDDEVVEATAELRRYGRDGMYAYVTGYLGAAINGITESHRHCPEANCLTCGQLRRARAMIAALDTTSAHYIGGGQ
jgi:hypothetical protein